MGGSFSKQLAWWRAAKRLLAVGCGTLGCPSRTAYAAKVDDDTFLHVPRLLADLGALACAPNLYYGR